MLFHEYLQVNIYYITRIKLKVQLA